MDFSEKKIIHHSANTSIFKCFGDVFFPDVYNNNYTFLILRILYHSEAECINFTILHKYKSNMKNFKDIQKYPIASSWTVKPNILF